MVGAEGKGGLEPARPFSPSPALVGRGGEFQVQFLSDTSSTKTWLPLPLLIDPRNYVKIFPILSRRIDQFMTLGPIFVKTGEKADGSGII